MNIRQQRAAALRWAVKTLAGTMTDRQIAEKYKLEVNTVAKTRQRMGMSKVMKAGSRPKGVALPVVS